MSYLLDTHVISELRKGRRAHASVLRWFTEVADAIEAQAKRRPRKPRS